MELKSKSEFEPKILEIKIKKSLRLKKSGNQEKFEAAKKLKARGI